MDEQTYSSSSSNTTTRKSFTATLHGWLVRVGLLTPPYGDPDEKLRTDPEVQKARMRLKLHTYDLPRYHR